ncbi:MAG: selenium metabolism protein YedF [Firmicutes bacterium]|nr:selenium metabolism protein YedF [Bacillota bacterium]
MSDKIIDCRGMACPGPVISTKKAIEGTESGKITIIVDNEVAKTNVTKFAAANNLSSAVENQDGHYYVTIVKGTGQAVSATATAANPANSGQAYLITQDTLGHGSPELGAVLIKAFMTTLLEVKPAPSAILMLNSGVKLAVKGSPVLDQLTTLAGRGVTILACGTCLDYYQCKAELAVGEVTNMYTIVETVSQNKTVTL